MNNIIKHSILISMLIFVGCGSEKTKTTPEVDETSQDLVSDNSTPDENTNDTKQIQEKDSTQTVICETNPSVNLVKNRVDVEQHTINISNKILNDMNNTLNNFENMNNAVFNTLESATKLITIIADDFEILEDESNNFSVIDNFSYTIPVFIINRPLTKQYILVSSPNRFFPDSNNIKTLFKDTKTLLTAWQRALNEADKTKNLYLTILVLNDDKSITNLTNGLLIKSADLF